MLSNLGNILLILIIIISFVIIYYSKKELENVEKTSLIKLHNLNLFQTVFSISCFFVLISGFITSDFSLSVVYNNSHTLKPIFYKISGAWGNHEGSLLLWVNILIIFSFFFFLYSKKFQREYRIYTLIIQNVLIIGFLFFILLNSNPFSLVIPTPKEGLGLNPILQDPALAIHPPLLYIGFVGSSIYFSAAMSSLITNYRGKLFANSIKSWVTISWCFQTLGIVVGSIWAYYELGWGGFWFWDPVENSSLMPWFIMTALIHSIVVLEKREKLYNWVIVLSLSTFILSVTGTFLVRSGVLNSVHTFANDPTRGIYLLSFLSLMVFFSIYLFFKKKNYESYNFHFNSRETFILLNNWLMAFFLVTVFIGTVYPIFTEVLYQTKISVGPPFFNIVIIPLVIPLLIFMAIGPKISWIKNKLFKYKQSLLLLISSIIICILISLNSNHSILFYLIMVSSLVLILHSFIDFINSFKEKNYANFSRIISHLGFGMLIFFIGFNHVYSLEKDFNLKVGETKKFDNFQVNFKNLSTIKRKNHQAILGNFEIINLNNSSKENLVPEIRVYKNPEMLTYEASIRSKISEDLYLTMSNISRSDFYNIKFQKKPFMFCIWLSAIIISIGGFLRVIRYEK